MKLDESSADLVSVGLAVAVSLHITGRDDVLRRLKNRSFRLRACELILEQLRKELADVAWQPPPDSEYRELLDKIIAAAHD
jgi:hypothetical protein